MKRRLFRRASARWTALALTLAIGVPLSPLSPFHADEAVAAKKKRKKSEPRQLEIDLPVQEFTLENGLRVYMVEDHSTPTLNISLLYKVGSIDEVEGRTGFAHFFEHMMFMGSKNMKRAHIAENTERAGGDVNAFTMNDATVYFHTIPSNYLDMVLWGEADRLSALEITEEAFETQRAAVKSEMNMRVDNVPYMRAVQFDLFGDIYKGTAYEHPPIGYLEDLDAAEVSDVQAFFDKYYMPNNCYMVIVGDIDPADVKAKVEKYFGGIGKGAQPPAPQVGEMQRGRKIDKKVADAKAKQAIYLAGWPTVGQQHEDAAALDILGGILFGGESARVPKILTDEKKMVVGAGGAHQANVYAGMMFMQAVPKDGVAKADIQKVILDEIDKIAKKGPTDAELAKALNGQLMGSLSTIATNQGRAVAIAMGAAFANDPKFVITQLDAYRKVTAEDVKRVAQTYITSDWIFYEIGPE